MARRVARYHIFLSTPQTGVIKAADAALEEEHGLLRRCEARYTPEYLATAGAIPLDPLHLTLQASTIRLPCNGGGQPGVLDDYLPAAWGRKVLAQLAFYMRRERVSALSPIDMLAMREVSHIGALEWVPAGETPRFALGASMHDLSKAEQTAQAVEAGTRPDAADSMAADALGLVYLANAGSGAGGARPKALIHDGGIAYLAKFNRLHGDPYNNARVELACLRMAAAAGIAAADAKVISGINGREVLLIKRFDVDGGHRRHLMTVNALLKDAETQRDRSGVFRYDDVAELIRRLSAAPQQDLEQLLRLMLFNAAIHNTDDHERNFSFRFDYDALRLAPAYDLVPSLTHGEYHAAGYGYAPSPPLPADISGRVFGLPKPRVQEAVDAVMAAVSAWPELAAEAGIAEAESQRIGEFIKVE